MKKIICLMLALLLSLAFAGCSCAGSSSFNEPEGAFWLQNPLFLSVPDDFSESAEYKVSVTKSKDSKITPTLSGTYGYTLSTITNPETNANYYLLETSLVLNGTYVYNEQTYTVNDSIESMVVFNGVDEKLKPLYTEKSIKTTTPVLNGNGNTTFENYEFSYTVDYSVDSGKDALITYTDTKGNSGLPASQTFDGFFSSSFCENELLTLYPRMYTRDEDFSLSLKVLNPANNVKETINVTTQTFEATYSENYWNNPELLVDCLTFTKSGTYSGIPIYAYYASNQGKKLENGKRINQSYLKHVMVKMQTGIADVGTMTYELTSFTNSQNG